MAIPALRALDAFPVDDGGSSMICLRDHEGYMPDAVLLSPPAFFLATLFDGEMDAESVRAAFREKYGQEVSAVAVAQLAGALDEGGALYSPAFLRRKEEADASYLAAPVRPAYLAGKSYPDEALALRGLIETFFTSAQGPGRKPDPAKHGPTPKGIVAPHIDFQRGGPAYGHAYLPLGDAEPPDVAFLFGTVHTGPPSPFILTRKHFATPLAEVRTAGESVDRLAAALSNPFEHEIAHRTEHSLEFQVVMLAALFGGAVPIVPVLCSSGGRDDAEERARFMAACREEMSRFKRPVVVAGVDLAHVGRRFGDDMDITDEVLKAVEARDREDLLHVSNPNPAKFFASVMKDGNERRVCGLYALRAALSGLEGRALGRVLYYGSAPDPSGGIVSFASAAFY